MTMVDDERLRSLLAEMAGAVEVPETGAAKILAEARTPDRGDPVTTSTGPRRVRRRVVLVAAAAVALAGGITLADGLPGRSAVQPVAGSARSVGSGASAAPHGRAGPAAVGSVPRTSSSAGGTVGGSSSAGGGGTAAPGSNSPANPGPSPTPTPTPLPAGVVGQSAKVEATGTVALAVGRGALDQVVAKLTGLATGAGGFVAKSQLQVGSAGGPDPLYGTLVLQVPEPSFGTLLTQVQRVATVTSVTSNATDVTSQYVDLQARISALQASRQQYLTILSKAESIGDILSVQSQLDTIQSQIEELQGQLSVLDSQTTYGTVTVSLSGAGHPVPPPPPPRSGLTTAWHDSVGGFVSGVEWLIRVAGPTLFVLLFGAAVVVAGRWVWRASRRRLL
jgi:hypothetical protein